MTNEISWSQEQMAGARALQKLIFEIMLDHFDMYTTHQLID